MESSHSQDNHATLNSTNVLVRAPAADPRARPARPTARAARHPPGHADSTWHPGPRARQRNIAIPLDCVLRRAMCD